MFKVIVAGSRGFSDLQLLETKLDFLLDERLPKVEIVSGTARGADQLGERYAEDRELPVKRFPAQWHRYGRSAGYRRNVQMAEYADALVAFWDGKSRGTQHMIDVAQKYGLEIRIIRYDML